MIVTRFDVVNLAFAIIDLKKQLIKTEEELKKVKMKSSAIIQQTMRIIHKQNEDKEFEESFKSFFNFDEILNKNQPLTVVSDEDIKVYYSGKKLEVDFSESLSKLLSESDKDRIIIFLNEVSNILSEKKKESEVKE